MNAIRLNLGSGTGRKADFLSVDLYVPEADIHHDATEPFDYKDGEVEEIFTSHLIEHLDRDQWAKALPEWTRILRVGGKLEIYCPDLFECTKWFLASDYESRWGWWIKTIYGSQEAEGQIHKNGFTLDKLTNDLEHAGYRIVKAEQRLENAELHVIAKKT